MKHFRTNSDAGSVKVGTPTFATLINNGMGDGITDVYVLDPDEEVPESATFQNCIEGEFYIFADDCGATRAITKLKGRYGAYSNEGEVYFEKWEDWNDGE